MGALISRLPLTPLLVLSAIVELGLNRIGTHLIGHAAAKDDPLHHIVDVGGLFAFYLTGLLALAVFTWGAVTLIRDRNLLRIPDRMTFTFLAALFLPLALMGLFLTLPKSVAPHLNTSFGLLLLTMTVGFLRRPAPIRAKLGVVYLCAPMLLHCYWLLTQQAPALAPTGRYGELPSQLFETGEHLMVVGAFAAFLFFAPFPRRSSLLSPLPLSFAAFVTAAVAMFLRYRYPDAALAAYHGLGISIPPPAMQVLMHLAALFFFVFTVGVLVGRAGPERSTGIGLALVGLSGFQLQLPYQLLLALSGMLEVMRSSMQLQPGTAEAPPPPPESWKAYLRRLAAACSRPPAAGEAVVLQSEGRQIGHVRGSRDGLPFTLRLLHDRDGLTRFEVAVGHPPKDAAPLSLRRTRGSRAGRVTDTGTAPRVRLEDKELDRQFVVRDSTGQVAALLGDVETQTHLQALIHGWLGLWPQEGVHYLTRPGPDGWPVPLAELAFSPEVAATEEIEALLALLSSLALRLKVARQ
jgi:hypothetical protein